MYSQTAVDDDAGSSPRSIALPPGPTSHMMDFSPLEQNVKRKDVDGRLEAAGVSGERDVSTEKRSWKSYLWDSWDKSPEVRTSVGEAHDDRELNADGENRNGS